jgi:hypothetical protein
MRALFRGRSRSPASAHARAAAIAPSRVGSAHRCQFSLGASRRARPRASAARGVENDGGVCLALLLARRAPYALGDGGARGALRPAPLHEPPRHRRPHAGKEARLVRLPRHNEVVPVRWSLLCRVRSRYAPRSRSDRYHELARRGGPPCVFARLQTRRSVTNVSAARAPAAAPRRSARGD